MDATSGEHYHLTFGNPTFEGEIMKNHRRNNVTAAKLVGRSFGE
jgi:hypothetical protein